jgi:diguanylate cyclase (GGDEF)-like protein
MLGILPTMFLTVAVGRHLANILQARQQAARRDSAQAALGPRLLAVNDAAEIRDVAWVAVEAICRATPGLRVLKVFLENGVLHVGRTSAGFTEVPATLSGDDLAHLDGREEAQPMSAFRSAGLDTAVGTSCSWVPVALPDVPDERARAWFLLGFAGPVSFEAVTSMTSLADQVALALRNSEVHRELTVLATLDNLTGLANRASFNAGLLSALSHPRQPGQHTSVLFVDLDDFKDVNDLLGHSAGDELLKEVAVRLTRATRPGDLCARLGGDEFAVLLAGTPAPAAIDVAGRVVAALSAPCALRDGTARVTASVGLDGRRGNEHPTAAHALRGRRHVRREGQRQGAGAGVRARAAAA